MTAGVGGPSGDEDRWIGSVPCGRRKINIFVSSTMPKDKDQDIINRVRTILEETIQKKGGNLPLEDTRIELQNGSYVLIRDAEKIKPVIAARIAAREGTKKFLVASGLDQDPEVMEIYYQYKFQNLEKKPFFKSYAEAAKAKNYESLTLVIKMLSKQQLQILCVVNLLSLEKFGMLL